MYLQLNINQDLDISIGSITKIWMLKQMQYLKEELVELLLNQIQDTCYLSDLYVVPEMRGNWIARKLIHKVAQQAKDCGVKGVYWNTQETNYKGRMLYDQVAKKAPFIIYEIE